jgi:hypothetical protein
MAFRSNLLLQSHTPNLLPPLPLHKIETSGTSQNFSTHLQNYTTSHPTQSLAPSIITTSWNISPIATYLSSPVLKFFFPWTFEAPNKSDRRRWKSCAQLKRGPKFFFFGGGGGRILPRGSLIVTVGQTDGYDEGNSRFFFQNCFVFAPRKPLSPLHGASSNAHFRLVEAFFVILLPLVMRYVRTPVNTGTMFLLHLLLNWNKADVLIQNVFKQGRDFMLNKRLDKIADPNDVHHRL